MLPCHTNISIAIHTVHLDHLEMKRMPTDPPRQPLLTRKKTTPRERKDPLTHTAHLWDDTFYAIPRVMKRWFPFFNLLEERFSCYWLRCWYCSSLTEFSYYSFCNSSCDFFIMVPPWLLNLPIKRPLASQQTVMQMGVAAKRRKGR